MRVWEHRRAAGSPARNTLRSTPNASGLVELQRLAGNRAVTELIVSQRKVAARRLVVQRHNSYEHQLLGNTKPQDLHDKAAPQPSDEEFEGKPTPEQLAKYHVVREEVERVM